MQMHTLLLFLCVLELFFFLKERYGHGNQLVGLNLHIQHAAMKLDENSIGGKWLLFSVHLAHLLFHC